MNKDINNKYFSGKDIKACIFDLDGTLLDSLHIWKEVDNVFLAKYNLTLNADYVKNISALTFYEAAVYTKKVYNLKQSAEDIMKEWNDIVVDAYRTSILIKPFALEFLTKLKDSGYKLCVATSLPRTTHSLSLEFNKMTDLFEFACCVEDVGVNKEKPDIWLHASSKLGVEPKECVVFEDVVPAMKSAKSVGCSIVGA